MMGWGSHVCDRPSIKRRTVDAVPAQGRDLCETGGLGRDRKRRTTLATAGHPAHHPRHSGPEAGRSGGVRIRNPVRDGGGVGQARNRRRHGMEPGQAPPRSAWFAFRNDAMEYSRRSSAVAGIEAERDAARARRRLCGVTPRGRGARRFRGRRRCGSGRSSAPVPRSRSTASAPRRWFPRPWRRSAG